MKVVEAVREEEEEVVVVVMVVEEEGVPGPREKWRQSEWGWRLPPRLRTCLAKRFIRQGE